MALATAGRAAHPILADGLRAVIPLLKLPPPDVLLVDSIRGEILDQSEIERAVRIEREASAGCHACVVSGIGRRADVAKIGGGGDASNCASVPTAAKIAV